MERGRGTPTIHDVARAAGVSTATVSRVMSGIGGARPETRGRVLAAVAALGYRPSAVARSLKRRSTRTIGLLLTDIANPYFPELVRAIEDSALERDYALLLCTGAEDPDREAAYLELLIERRVDGIIVATSSVSGRYGPLLASSPVPVVLVNTLAPGTGLPAILSDNRGGAASATRHLLELGHRRIGLITGPARYPTAVERLAGVRETLRGRRAAGVSLATVAGLGSVASGEAAAGELLTRHPDLTGLLCYNDLMAVGALQAARALGRRVPADLSVVGFDDVTLARYVDPPLTTVAQDKVRMGAGAVEVVARLLAGGRAEETFPCDPAIVASVEGPVLRLRTTLCIRASTGPAPQS